jgi:hypothetical protein
MLTAVTPDLWIVEGRPVSFLGFPARRALRKALDWDPERLIIAHGVWVRENGREVLRRSLAWLGV